MKTINYPGVLECRLSFRSPAHCLQLLTDGYTAVFLTHEETSTGVFWIVEIYNPGYKAYTAASFLDAVLIANEYL